MTEDPGLRLVDFLDHIVEASRLALEYVAGMDQQAFLRDRRTQQAVVLAARHTQPCLRDRRRPSCWQRSRGHRASI